MVFLAELSNDPLAEFSPGLNFISNAAAPAYPGYIAKRAGIRRYIYAGSCSVYGYTINELYDEELPAVSSYPYGISKLQGEQAVMQMKDNDFSVIAFRQGTVSGYSPRMRLANEKEEVRVVTDEVLTPTPTSEIARHTYQIISRGSYGLYHLTSEGQCSWYEFAEVIFDTLHLSTPLQKVVVANFPMEVKRPTYSILENVRLKEQGLVSLPHWKDSLVAFLRGVFI